MRFSEEFNVVPSEDDDWFDTLLTADTPLYIDPFLIYDDRDEFWAAAHDHLTDFFAMVLYIIKKSNGNRNSTAWNKAKQLLVFKEPREFCLGLSFGQACNRRERRLASLVVSE